QHARNVKTREVAEVFGHEAQLVCRASSRNLANAATAAAAAQTCSKMEGGVSASPQRQQGHPCRRGWLVMTPPLGHRSEGGGSTNDETCRNQRIPAPKPSDDFSSREPTVLRAGLACVPRGAWAACVR